MHSYTYSYTFPQECVSAYVDGIPRAEYAEVKGMSHQAHLEDTEKYIGIIDVSSIPVCVYAYVCMYVYMYVCMYVCMYHTKHIWKTHKSK